MAIKRYWCKWILPPRVLELGFAKRIKLMNSTMSSRKLKVICSDNSSLDVDKDIIEESKTIRRIYEEEPAKDSITLPTVTSEVFSQVFLYLEKHFEARKIDINEEDLKAWDAKFIETNLANICNLILAADYLDIKSLLDLTCKTVADINQKMLDLDDLEWEWVYPEEEEKGGEGSLGEAGAFD